MKLQVIRDFLTGSNCYLLEENGQALLVDPNAAEEIIKILKSHECTLSHIILTHEHSDHISGLNRLREWSSQKIEVVASTKCSRNLQDTKMNLSRIFGLYLFYLNGERCRDYPVYTCEPATQTFRDVYEFAWQSHKFKLFHIPGHSEGSIAAVLDQDIVFSGDSFLKDQEIVTEFPGGSEADYQKYALPFFAGLPEDIWIYPGHGEIFRKSEGSAAETSEINANRNRK